jgi:hypothetical protein
MTTSTAAAVEIFGATRPATTDNERITKSGFSEHYCPAARKGVNRVTAASGDGW